MVAFHFVTEIHILPWKQKCHLKTDVTKNMNGKQGTANGWRNLVKRVNLYICDLKAKFFRLAPVFAVIGLHACVSISPIGSVTGKSIPGWVFEVKVPEITKQWSDPRSQLFHLQLHFKYIYIHFIRSWIVCITSFDVHLFFLLKSEFLGWERCLFQNHYR